jgi:hypothetical protein
MTYKYIVTNDRSYYPSVEYFDDLETATKQYEQELSETEENGAGPIVKVTLSQVIKIGEMKDW